KLHFEPSVAAPDSSTVTRKRTWRTMPRVASFAGTSTLEPMPCRPSARSVARLRAMWLIELLTWVTRSVAAPGSAGIGCLRRLAGEGERAGHAAAGAEPGGRTQAAQTLECGSRDVHRVGRAVDLRQDVADARGLDDRAHRAAGDDPGALACGLENDDARGI